MVFPKISCPCYIRYSGGEAMSNGEVLITPLQLHVIHLSHRPCVFFSLRYSHSWDKLNVNVVYIMCLHSITKD